MITPNDIRDGLNRGEFFLEYLPTVSLEDGHCVGAEALLRWQRPNGIILPQDFIPIAENTPLSGLLTYWVFDTVAVELADWLRENRNAYLSINVPPEIIGRGGMEYAATKSGLIDLSAQLILEVTERGVPDQIAVAALGDIWGRGILVALDDVTLVGGANMAILSRCPFHIIKLDRSLIGLIEEGLALPEWISSISALLDTSKLRVIAEGVETEWQYTVLRTAGIQYAQGYYFSRPINAERFKEYFHAKSRSVGA